MKPTTSFEEERNQSRAFMLEVVECARNYQISVEKIPPSVSFLIRDTRLGITHIEHLQGNPFKNEVELLWIANIIQQFNSFPEKNLQFHSINGGIGVQVDEYVIAIAGFSAQNAIEICCCVLAKAIEDTINLSSNKKVKMLTILKQIVVEA